MILYHMKKTHITLAFLSLALTAMAQDFSYTEAPNPTETVASDWAPLTAPVVGWGNTDTRYAKEKPVLTTLGKSLALEAWRGETVSAQLVVSSPSDLDNITIELSDLTNGRHSIPATSIRKGFVRYVITDELNPGNNGNCGYRVSTDFDSSLVADVIDHHALSMPVMANSTQPVWLMIKVPADTKAGTYRGTVSVMDNNKLLAALNMSVKVTGRVLPEPKDWAYHLDLWQNPYSEARVYGVPLWSAEHFRLMKPDMELYAQAGGKVITASIINRPWDGQTEDAFDNMITCIKRLDGTWSYDYAVFDRWVEFMMSVGVTGQIHCFSMVPWRMSFEYFDQATNRMQRVTCKATDQAYHDFWLPLLTDFASHLKSKGWYEKTYIAMDERPREAMQAAYDIIRASDPDWKIALAGIYYPEFSEWLTDYCIPVDKDFEPQLLEERRLSGKTSTFYTCCTESHPNTFTFSDPAESEWISWFSARKGLDGYLRWAFNSWTRQPLQDSRFRAWPAGDCYMIYPYGRTSIRLARFVDGVQSYEKIRILREEFERRNNRRGLKAIDAILRDFDLQKVQTESPASLIKNARKRLNSL